MSNWVSIKLIDLCNVEYGTRVVRKRDAGTIFPVYGGGGATFSMDVYNRENRMVIARFAMSKKCTRFVRGKFFLNDSGLTISAKDNALIDEQFLNYQILSLNDTIYSLARGTAQKNLNVDEFKNLTLSFPDSIQEQKEIVEILDQAFESIEKAKTNIEKNIENAKELHESRIYNLFHYSDWNKLKWGHVCDFTRGPFGGSLKKSMFVDSGYAVYEQKQAIHNDYGAIRYFVDEQKFFAMKRFEVLPGDLLMSCSGVTLGRISEVPEGAPRGIINQALLKLRTKKDLVLNKFIIYWIRSKVFQDLIFKFSGGAAQPNVPGVKILKEVIIPCPSIENQKEIVETLDTIDNHIQSLLLVYKEELDNLEELKKSILQKAFTGELTNKNKAA